MELLQLFRKQPDQFVSGEELSQLLGCSRTAVWKHINQLKKQGYQFEAVRRKGYRLIGQPDRLTAAELLPRLTTRTLGRNMTIMERVESTQIIAHERSKQGAEEGVLILAEEQAAGRGRMGRVWHSPAGKGIWMSLVLRPRIPLHFTPQLTLLVSVAVCRAIRQITNVKAEIKWPNDILVNGKKVCGILLESSAEDERLLYVVAGIGISVNLKEDDYPPELRTKATSLFIESGVFIRREELIAEVLAELEQWYQLYHEEGFGTIRSLWEALSMSLGRNVTVTNAAGTTEGFAEALDELGALIVRLPDGTRQKVYSGDIDVRPSAGI
jgi:BirA family transcriptional regulator, biotin operon repressor / biotin---[acetyl-CoA-carboxylase] ligase